MIFHFIAEACVEVVVQYQHKYTAKLKFVQDDIWVKYILIHGIVLTKFDKLSDFIASLHRKLFDQFEDTL